MAFKEQLKQRENFIIALAVPVILALIAGLYFDYYYDLNDDVLMKDILAGVYTGTPEGHNIQMLWLISAFISLFYRICRTLPWYGLFLCFCHFGCLFLILKRSFSFCMTLKGKLVTAVTEGVLFGALFMEHLIYAQYTVTCTLLAGTAAFLFFTTDNELQGGAFVKKNIPSILLVAVAFLVRSEMLLLVFPMICVAGVAKWGSERKIFTKANTTKYFSVFGLIILGILIGQGTHMIAYSSAPWQTFTEFFDNRTELYDFQVPPTYEENKEFYENIGLSQSEKILLDNYNFGMDEEIDEKLVGEIAVYAGQQKSQAMPFTDKMKIKLQNYTYRLTHGQGVAGSDYPWNYAIILGYVAAFGLAVPKRKTASKDLSKTRHYLYNILGVSWKLILLFGVRTALWMYILMGDRDPERITHSLYLMELCILAAMVFAEIKQISSEKVKKTAPLVCMAGFMILAVIIWPTQLRSVLDRQTQRAEVNAPYEELYSYLTTGEQADNFYFIDVYSSVSYSEKMFTDVDNSLDNYDIMGGWACKSPLQRKKMAAFGIDNMEQALRDSDNVFFVRKTSEDMKWLTAYYEGHGTPVETRLVDTVAGIFEIYAVEAK